MFELIIFIIIISVVMKSKKKQKTVPKKTTQQPTPIPNRTMQTTARTGAVQNRPAQSRQTQNRPAQNKPAKTAEEPKQMSTTEMLEAKALADDREEMKEKQRQRMENKKHYGHLNYAQRYVIGDAVPKGQKMVFCRYCNAENLIPMYSLAKDYNCYFCREEL